jgi:hypothetical protein
MLNPSHKHGEVVVIVHQTSDQAVRLLLQNSKVYHDAPVWVVARRKNTKLEVFKVMLLSNTEALLLLSSSSKYPNIVERLLTDLIILDFQMI